MQTKFLKKFLMKNIQILIYKKCVDISFNFNNIAYAI